MAMLVMMLPSVWGGGAGLAGAASSSGYSPGGTLQVLMGTPPDSLDPQYGYTNQSYEADWIVYTGLVTYAHKNGADGEVVIPGLATALPLISNDSKTYTLTLRKGLKFSNGVAVVASDFAHSIERAVKLGWGGDSFYTENIVGAAAYQAGKSSTISGIVTNDSTGKITINLVAPYGAFTNVLALPSSGVVPGTTPMKVLSASPPPGVGPYMITAVEPDRYFTLTKNPLFKTFNIPKIPDGYVNKIQVTIASNANTEAEEVLDNQADVFDTSDIIPPSLISQIQTSAKDRYRLLVVNQTDYFFLNSRTKPFTNATVREAVNLAVSRVALERLASGEITPACFFLPPNIVGHPTGKCNFGAPSGAGSFSATSLGSSKDVKEAKALVKKAGFAGYPVTVWGETGQPFQSFSTYLASELDAIGLKATLKIIANSIYSQTIGSVHTNPQSGYYYWAADFPNPADFYLVLDARSINAVDNENLGYDDDSHIQSTITRLDQVPASDVESVAAQWAALDKYNASKDYMVPFGYVVTPLFVSNRVDFKKVVFNEADCKHASKTATPARRKQQHVIVS
jgi:peptide/nickel transport system substrate-binding protein